MFYPFKPGLSQQHAGAQPGKLQKKIASIQRSWANRLNKRARNLDPKKLKATLILTGVIACATAAGLVYRGINPQSLTIHRFDQSLPRFFDPIAIPESPAKQQALDRYLDSLERAFIKDSIQNAKSITGHDTSNLH